MFLEETELIRELEEVRRFSLAKGIDEESIQFDMQPEQIRISGTLINTNAEPIIYYLDYTSPSWNSFTQRLFRN